MVVRVLCYSLEVGTTVTCHTLPFYHIASSLPYSLLAFQLSGQQESHFWLLLIQDEKQRYTDSGIKTKIIMAYSAVGANDVEPILERTLLLKQEACIYKIPSSQVSWSGMCSF